MTNFFSTIYFALVFFIFGHPKPELTPELKEFCTAIMFDQEEKIETLMTKINQNQKLPYHSSLIDFAIEVRAYDCCQKLISNGFRVTLDDLKKLTWLQMLESLPEKKQSAANLCLSIEEKLTPQKNQRGLSNMDIANWRSQIQSPVGQLHKAIIANDISVIQKLLSDNHLDPNTRLNYISALEIAIAHSNLQAINSLLKTGKINLTEEDVSKAVWRLNLIENSQPGIPFLDLIKNPESGVSFANLMENAQPGESLRDKLYRIKDSKVELCSADDVDLTVKKIEQWTELLNNAKRIQAILTQNLKLQRKFPE